MSHILSIMHLIFLSFFFVFLVPLQQVALKVQLCSPVVKILAAASNEFATKKSCCQRLPGMHRLPPQFCCL